MFRHKWFRQLFRRRVLVILLLLLQLITLVCLVFSTGIVSSAFKAVLAVVSVCVALYVAARSDVGAYKLIWVFMLLLFPVFGGLFYLLFHYQSTSKLLADRVGRAHRKAVNQLLTMDTCLEKAGLTVPDRITQMRYLQNHAGFPVCDCTRTKYLTPGEEKLRHLLQELEKAKRYIFLEYFIIREGEMWNAVLEVLRKKAAQGVRVRLIYDDMGCFLNLPADYPRQLAELGIECRIFNPFQPFLSAIQNNRDHRKIVSVDGRVAFTGGINLADEYINAVVRYGYWKDAAVMLEGRAAWSLTVLFLQMWEVCTGTDEDYALYYPYNEAACTVRAKGFVQPYGDSPLDRNNVGEQVYMRMINSARDYLYISTPYLIIDDSMLSALCLAAESGVDVRIMTPHKWDKWAVHMTTRSYYRDLIGAGVAIFEYTDGFIHSKTFVSDDLTACVGTTNLDFRSLYLHFECGVCMYGTDAVMQLKEDFLQTLEVCRRITPDDCRAGLLMRILQTVLRLFAPLM